VSDGESFGAVLRGARLAAGLTQEELAARSGLSVRAISDLESGRTRRPYLRSVGLLADALNVPEPVRNELREAAREARLPDEKARFTAASVPSAAPRQLPGTVRHFTGRSAELQSLSGLLEEAGAGGPMIISAIGGTAGVGKTALAVHWAHQVADHFPDGQLYVNLRGYDPGQPVQPADALAGFLRALGVPSKDIPAEADERAALYRSQIAERRMLIVLDNAREVDRVRPLLPGTPASMVLVTSRDSLPGLVALDGAVRIDLDLLPLSEAVSLLTALIGERAVANLAATTALATQCARLPLALRVAAELAGTRAAAPLTDLVDELADRQRRLELLDINGDSRTAVRAVFSWSYEHLAPGAARAFRLASLHPGPDLEPYALAALTDMTAEQAGQTLDQLARAHLVHPTGPGRYGLHDLLRAYAAELAATHDGQDAQHAALTRLFDHYLYTASSAIDGLTLARSYGRPHISQPATPTPPVTEGAAARTWLDTQLPSLVAVAEHTAAHGWAGHTTRLAVTLNRYLNISGSCPEAITIHTCALRAARRTGDHAAEVTALTSLGSYEWWQGRYQQAIHRYQQSLDLSRQTGDGAAEARTLNDLGLVYMHQGDYQQATDHYRQSLDLCRANGHQQGEAHTLNNLGTIYRQQGRYQKASDHHQEALTLFRETGDRNGEAWALSGLGTIDQQQGRYQEASDRYQEALGLFRETGSLNSEAYMLMDLGIVELGRGHFQQATDHLQWALTLCRETDDRSGEAKALNGLGDILLASGKAGRARTQHTAALDLANQIGSKYQQAQAHNGLAHANNALGHRRQARRHWQEALALYVDLGTPETDEVRTSLRSLDAITTGR
jgi:tetratricopeptide (TPR) repeat protein/DNA-binding XRE family transcriptional regulator